MTYPTQGHWRELLPQFGVSPRILNGKHHPCPMCGGKDRFRFSDRSGSGSYYCNQCGPGNGFSLMMNINSWDFEEAYERACSVLGNTKPITRVEPKKMDNIKMLRDLWTSSYPLDCGDPVDLYLSSRGVQEKYSTVIRYVPSMYHSPSKSNHPGMIALISDAEGKPALLHRTYLTSDGRKAAVNPQRMLMPGEFPRGGAIRLGKPAEVMGVAEGIETAMAASILHRIPVWSVISEGFMRSWKPPAEARRIAIFGDNDANFVGQSAALDLAKRLSGDVQVSVYIPDVADSDWNDVLLCFNRETKAFVKGLENAYGPREGGANA
jgi:putative DNA primase/helicase